MENKNLITYGILGIAGFFLLKSFSKKEDNSFTGSTGGGAYTWTSAPILDSFNTSSVDNTSSPTYFSLTNAPVNYNPLSSGNDSLPNLGASGNLPKKAENLTTLSPEAVEKLNLLNLSSPNWNAPLSTGYLSGTMTTEQQPTFFINGSSSPALSSGSTSSGTSTKKQTTTTSPTLSQVSTPLISSGTSTIKKVASTIQQTAQYSPAKLITNAIRRVFRRRR